MVEPSHITVPLHFVAVRRLAAEGQTDRMVCDVEVCMKQRDGIEVLYMEEKLPMMFINVYGD